MELPDFRVPRTSCPQCRSPNDSALSIDLTSPGPKPGDVGVCAYCAAVLTYDANLRLRIAPPDHPAHNHPEIGRVIAAVLEVKFRRSQP